MLAPSPSAWRNRVVRRGRSGRRAIVTAASMSSPSAARGPSAVAARRPPRRWATARCRSATARRRSSRSRSTVRCPSEKTTGSPGHAPLDGDDVVARRRRQVVGVGDPQVAIGRRRRPGDEVRAAPVDDDRRRPATAGSSRSPRWRRRTALVGPRRHPRRRRRSRRPARASPARVASRYRSARASCSSARPAVRSGVEVDRLAQRRRRGHADPARPRDACR